MEKKKISFVIPAYSEQENINKIYIWLKKIILNIQEKFDYEIIFVNDGSKDNTWVEILKLWQKDSDIKGINFSRNFWKELAITAWLEYSCWDCVITLDCDLQHPIDKIPLFLEKWEQWFEIVYNKRPNIKWSSFFKRFSSYIFYKVFNMISDFKLEHWTTDYRLLDRKVVDVFLKFKEKNRLYRWIVDFIWFNKIALIFDALPNQIWRKPSYSYLKLYNLAINSITSFSVLPLKIVWYMWLLITFVSSILLFVMILDKLWVLNLEFTNLAIVVVINTILIWIVLMSLWMIALYIANIHQEVVWRPLYIIKDKINLEN